MNLLVLIGFLAVISQIAAFSTAKPRILVHLGSSSKINPTSIQDDILVVSSLRVRVFLCFDCAQGN